MPHEEHPHAEEFDSLPPAVIDALRELDGPAVMPDPARDADVLSGARQHLAPVSKKQRNLRLFFAGGLGSAVAAAAVVGIVVLVGNPLSDPQYEMAAEMDLSEAEPTAQAPAIAGDIDHSGGVDMLDAYALAKQIRRSYASATQDLNGDGTVDQRDVDWLANRAVALNNGEQG